MKTVSDLSKKQNTGDLKVIKALGDFSRQLRSTSDQTQAALDSIKNNLNDIKKRIDDYSY